MKSFLVLLSQKQPSLFNNHLLKRHIDFLKQLDADSRLLICGPFTDNQGAILIIKADSLSQVEEIVNTDPFIKEGYYTKYTIHEFKIAGAHNDWLTS